jgi:hypothetical protein
MKPKKVRTTFYLEEENAKFLRANKGSGSWFVNKLIDESDEFKKWKREKK